MNLLEFKQLVRTGEYTESFTLFKIWVEQHYDLYLKQVEILYATKKHETEMEYTNSDLANSRYYDEILPDLKITWEDFSFSRAIEIYSKMGWSDSAINKMEIKYHAESDSLFFEYSIQEIFSKIKNTCTDSAEFFYAISLLKNFIIDTQNKDGINILKEQIVKGLKVYKLMNLAAEIIKGNDVFVAMSFSENMDSARKCIKEVLFELEYNPIIIDEKQHNNQIPEEIFTEIDKSYFVIADLTEQKGGVYLEAGYALAKKKNVIFLCNNTEKEKVHFDVKQINTIFWEDEQDLKTRLKKRIQVTI